MTGYRRWPSVDIPLHFLGGFAIAFFVSGGIQLFADQKLMDRPDPWIHTALVLTATCTIAVLWEFAEWTADHTIGTHCQLGLDDTLLDLLIGMIGGLAFVWTRACWKKRTQAATPATTGGNH